MKSKSLSRRQFVKTVGATALAATFPGMLDSCGKQEKKPNIIFLLTDDQRWDALGCMGNPIIQTPNIDRMASEGVLFSNAFVTTSICCTSRASIFLGQYARRHGIHDFKTDFTPGQLAHTYDMLLKKAGYRVGFIGKYGVGRNLPADKYDYWRGIPGQPIYENIDKNGNYKHLTRIMGEQAIEFLEGCSNEQPFCLSISFKAPHVQDNDPRQFIYDPAYQHLYQDVKIPTPKTASDQYFYAFPDFFTRDNEGRRRWQIRFSTPEKYQEMVKGYYRLITGVDAVVGKIRENLERLGLAKNTVIIYSSDNGFFLGEHGLAGKWYGYEPSIRVPLIIFDPRLPQNSQGQVREEMVLNIDIAPTILDIVGIEIPQAVQGKSMLPLVQGKKIPWRQEFFYEHLFEHDKIPKSEGVITKRYKYLRYIETQPVYEELFDLQEDPHEIRNLAKDKNYQTLLNKLRQKCDEMAKNLI